MTKSHFVYLKFNKLINKHARLNIWHVPVVFILFVFVVSFSSCKEPANSPQRQSIAKVYDNHLYIDDIEDYITEDMASEDSAQLIAGLVSKWIMHQLKLQQAELNLNPAQKDLSSEIEEYRSSLLIYKYEQEYIRQKLDTLVTAEDIRSYYEGFRPELLLDKPVIRCAYVIAPKNLPRYYTFRNWFRSQYNEKQDQINEYLQEHDIDSYFYSDEYIYFEDLIKHIPIESDNVESFLTYNKFIEKTGDEYKYLVNIFDYKLKSDIAPLNIVKNEIRNILLNKRKIQLIRDLEERIMNDAIRQNKIETK